MQMYQLLFIPIVREFTTFTPYQIFSEIRKGGDEQV
jgi:hypothetical protein